MKFFEKIRHYKNNWAVYLCFLNVDFIFFHIQILHVQHVKLGWDPGENPNIFSYNIYRTTHSDSSFSLLDNVLHPNSTYMDDNIERGTHYYYVATSVDKFGNESRFSNMIDTTIILSTSIVQAGFNAHLNVNNK